MTGAECVVSTDAGYWQLGASFMLKDATDDLAWRAVLANLEGRSNVLRFPVIDVRTTPADLAGTRATLQAQITAAGVYYSDGATHDDGTALDPASGDESRDWDIGEGVEFTFVVEAIQPGTSGNTVTIKAVGVNR